MDGKTFSSTQRGYDSRWQKARKTFLQSNPLCVMCQRRGKLSSAEVVDHIKPPRLKDALGSNDSVLITKARALFWDKTNWQPLCKECHDRDKQRLEKSGQVIGCDTNGIPLDPNHHWNRPAG